MGFCTRADLGEVDSDRVKWRRLATQRKVDERPVATYTETLVDFAEVVAERAFR